jgi:hypothetical protein
VYEELFRPYFCEVLKDVWSLHIWLLFSSIASSCLQQLAEHLSVRWCYDQEMSYQDLS